MSVTRRIRGVALTMSLAASVVAAMAVGAAPAAAAATILVPQQQPTIGAAIAAASSGDTIVVAPGTYHENLVFGNKAIDLRSSGGPDVTTIHGVNLDDQDGHQHPVVEMSAAGALVGFTVTGLDERTATAVVATGTTVVRDNRIVDNHPKYGGGGPIALFAMDSVVVDRNEFSGNCFPNGASREGIVYAQDSVQVTNNLFADNRCSTALDAGGGADGANGLRIINNTIVRNRLGLDVDGRYMGNAIVRNNLITDNEIGYQVDFAGDRPQFDHNFLGGNRKSSTGLHNPVGSNGNILGAPGFIDDSSDYELRSSSILVDAGSPTAAPAVDINGDPRPVGGGVDIGAYERDGTEPLPPRTGQTDLTWSQDGIMTMSSRYLVSLGPLASGRLYVGSWHVGDGGPFRIGRYNADGSYDDRYGFAGLQERSFSPNGTGFSFPHFVIPTGSRLLVLGEMYTTKDRLGVTRLTTTGDYDPTFSADGRVHYRVFKYEHDVVQPFKVRVLADGRIMVAVAAYDTRPYIGDVFQGQAIIRLRPDGSLDPTFSGDGVEVVPDDWSAVAFTSDGRSYASRPDGTLHDVMRLRADGSADRTFGGDGVAPVRCPDPPVVLIEADPSGRAVLMCEGFLDDQTTTIKLYRFTTSGDPDPAWAGSGSTHLSLPDAPPKSTFPPPRSWLFTFDDDAKPWIVASSEYSVAERQMLEVYTYGSDGRPDRGWSADGVQRTLLPYPVIFNRIAVGGGRLYTALQDRPQNVAVLAQVED